MTIDDALRMLRQIREDLGFDRGTVAAGLATAAIAERDGYPSLALDLRQQVEDAREMIQRQARWAVCAS